MTICISSAPTAPLPLRSSAPLTAAPLPFPGTSQLGTPALGCSAAACSLLLVPAHHTALPAALLQPAARHTAHSSSHSSTGPPKCPQHCTVWVLAPGAHSPCRPHSRDMPPGAGSCPTRARHRPACGQLHQERRLLSGFQRGRGFVCLLEV